MLSVDTLSPAHLDAANALAAAAYTEACEHLPALPRGATVPDLGHLAANGMGVAAFDAGRMVGVLAAVAPFAGLFGPTTGTFAPLGAFAVTGERRERTASALYEAAAARWIEVGALSHAVVAYAHDTAALEGLARSGFGRRTVDAIREARPLEPTPAPAGDVVLEELSPTRHGDALHLYRGMWAHLAATPTYLFPPDTSERALLDGIAGRGSRLFVARAGGALVGFLEVTHEGETFVDALPSVAHICGAYLMPEHRGDGVAAALLDHVLAVLAGEGRTHLGVDYEELNPTGRGFWLKHFTPFSLGVTRRIDERLFR